MLTFTNPSPFSDHEMIIAFLQKTVSAPTELKAVLTPAELERVIMRGRECEKGECSISDVDNLIMELQEQQHNLNERIQDIDNMVKSLDILNDSDDRDDDEVRETVRSIFRVFNMGAEASGNDMPSTGMATGYSGDVGSGPTDAYKSLNPKPWKASP